MAFQPDASLINDDIRPTRPDERTWSTLHIASLWIGMVVCITTYQLASGLIQLGMSAWQAVFTITVANFVVLVPMILNGHPGAKYGIPFPVLARSSFGIAGAHIPSLLRALVACGWFGIQTWMGGNAIYQLINVVSGAALDSAAMPFLGINPGQLGCFVLFWLVQLYFIHNGIETIRIFETWAAPVLIAMGLILLGWAYFAAGGFGPMMAAPSAFGPGAAKEGQFFSVFAPALTGMVGYWATLSLNIPDFTRYAKSQKDQLLGQALGLPTTMGLFAFIGVAVTSATTTVFGETIWDPTVLAGRIGGGVTVVAALFSLSIATLSTNIAANVVSPANALINVSPRNITFRMGGYVTALIGAVILPWKLLTDADTYINGWMVGYSALLGPIAGILLADYYLWRRTELDVDELYKRNGRYAYVRGFNPAALIALGLGILPNLPGFLHRVKLLASVPAFFDAVYTYAWFVGLLIAGISYLAGMALTQVAPGAAPAGQKP